MVHLYCEKGEIGSFKVLQQVSNNMVKVDFQYEALYDIDIPQSQYNCSLASQFSFCENRYISDKFLLAMDCDDGPALFVCATDGVTGLREGTNGESSPSCSPTQPNDCVCAWNFVFSSHNVDIGSKCSK